MEPSPYRDGCDTLPAAFNVLIPRNMGLTSNLERRKSSARTLLQRRCF
jgi:hypothetical protein